MAKVKDHFPNLAPYQPPQTGWLSRLPSATVPYVQLMRMDKPWGLAYFLFPHLFGAVQGAIFSMHDPSSLARTGVVLVAGNVFMRGATCTWNDIVDAPFDRQVERTRHRAIARGAVSVPQALAFTALQSALAGACLLALPRPTSVIAVPAVLGWFAYPLMKRVMDFPQAFLGFPMAWGVFVGASAVDALRPDALWSALRSPSTVTPPQTSICAMFAANAMWTFCYETMYSYQDVKYDRAAGVRSLALLVREPTAAKTMLAGMAASSVGLLAVAGHSMGAGLESPYFTGSVVGAGVTLALEVWKVDLGEPKSCLWWFARGGLMTGSAILGGLLSHYRLALTT